MSRLPRSGSISRWAQRAQQGDAAQAGSADHGALRQIGQAGIPVGDKGITRVFALHHAGEHKTLGQVHRHVFQGVHGQIGAAFLDRHFQFLDKQALAAHLAQ